MIKKLLGAVTMAAVMSSTVPAFAAHRMACSGDNLGKTESMIEAAADGPGKYMAYQEITMAQDAMLSGKMSACAMHLTKAMQDGMMQQSMMQQNMMQPDTK